MASYHQGDSIPTVIEASNVNFNTDANFFVEVVHATGEVVKRFAAKTAEGFFTTDVTIIDATHLRVNITDKESARLRLGEYSLLMRQLVNDGGFEDGVAYVSDTDYGFSIISKTESTDNIEGKSIYNGVATDGKSAYQVAVDEGFVGTEAEWLASLVGADGPQGPAGADGADGADGVDGDPGADGASAYEIAVAGGFVGTEAEWLASLVGADGADGVDAGQPLSSAPAPITIDTDVDWSALFTQIAAIANNWGGQPITVQPAAGTYNIGANTLSLLQPFNGRLRFSPATQLDTASSSQVVVFNINAAGFFNNGNPYIGFEMHSIKVVFASAGASGAVLTKGNFKSEYCCWDFSAVSKESYAALLYDCVGYSYEDTFIGHATQVTSAFKSAGAARVKIVNPHYVTTAMNYGLNGEGEVTVTGDTDGDLAIATPNYGGAIDLNATTESTPADVPTVTPGTTSATDSTISVPLTPNRTGTLYGRLYLASATPTASEVAAGTGAIETQSAVVAADTEETLVFSDAAIAASTAYRVFYWLEGFAPTVEVKNLTQSTTAPADVTAPTLQSATIEDAAPTDVVMVFDEAVTGTNLGFTLAGTTESTFASISGFGTNTLTGVLATAAANGETITLSYDSATGDITDTASPANDLTTFNSYAVSNNIAAPASYGANIVVNGLFSISLYAWSGTNWEWSDVNAGEALHTAGSADPLVGNTSETQAEVMQGQEYVVKYRVGGRTAGTIQATLGGNGAGLTRSADGYYSERITAGNTDTLIRFVPSSDFDGWIDEVVIQTVDGVPNMLVNGTFDNSTGLSLGAGYTVSDGVLNYDGLNTYANTTFSHNDKLYNGHNYHLKINVVTGPLILLLEVGGFEYEIDSNTYAVGLHEFDFTPTGLSQPSTFRIRANTGCGAGSVDNVEITETFA